MIVKERSKPIRIKAAEALLRRLPSHHAKRSTIEEDLAKWKAGFRGEESLHYYLSFLDENYLIFHDLRLKHKKYYFQIDVLVLTPSFAIILEVKNISGTLYFENTFDQLIRKKGDKEEAFSNPISQAERQKIQLQHWIERHRITNLPIEFLVIMSHPTAILKTSGHNPTLRNRISHIDQFLNKFNTFEKKYSHPITENQIRKLRRSLLRNHTELPFNVTHHFDIEQDQIMKGVHCPSCNTIPMARTRGTWFCRTCHFNSKEAHLHTINDYFLLIKPSITTSDFLTFTNLHSRSICSKLLAATGLPYRGKQQSRTYHPTN